MKLIAPDYYSEFRCTAGACGHSCCIGWEIDIDENTLAYYNSVSGDFGKRLSENISVDETPQFRLADHERCPFLNKDNLCDIILELGKNALCQICADHPRFRNFFDNRIEIGLGLCCEASAELILSRENKIQLIELDDDGEDSVSDEDKAFFDLRNAIFETFQNRALSIDERIDAVLLKYGIPFPQKSFAQWATIFLELEQLDPHWSEKLSLLKNADVTRFDLSEIALEQLLIYFIYRHVADGIYDGRFKGRIAFAVLSVHIIRGLCSVCDDSFCEIARMYSSEIEYSEENIDTLLNILTEDEND